jgi:ubiquinone/menaquinone biosynthesis C-methylase UbiE
MAEQYGTDANLRRRQSLYRFRRPGPDLFEWALDLAELDGDERVLDAGCGNGNYLAALSARHHLGPIVGVDLSHGMVSAARIRADAPLAAGDVAALPVRDGAVDVALCMHVLYHLDDQGVGAAELRRVVRPGGRALLVTNGRAHVAEIDDLVADIAGARPGRAMYSFTMEEGAEVLRTSFESVEAHMLRSALDVTDADAVIDYASSVDGLYDLVETGSIKAAIDEMRRHVDAVIERDGAFVVTTSTGCFVCR